MLVRDFPGTVRDRGRSVYLLSPSYAKSFPMAASVIRFAAADPMKQAMALGTSYFRLTPDVMNALGFLRGTLDAFPELIK